MNEKIEQNRGPVIIVEDDEPLLKSVVKYLTLEGYQVTGLSSAKEFYQRMFDEPYAVAILDIGLPDQCGLTLAEYVRKNTDMRIIMFTARASVDDMLLGHKAGADIYLVKPVDYRRISASIATLLSRLDSSVQPSSSVSEASVPTNLGQWQLITSQLTLHTPTGEYVKLTTKELGIMAILVSNPKMVVSRLLFLKTLGYLNNESGNHALHSLINRLRCKIESYNILSPIHTSHAIGYSFLGNITQE
jgi:DNA-binding response OmpR family regulator